MPDAYLAPYLTFQGNCREAMEFYHSVMGGELDLLMPEDDVRRVFDAAHEPKLLWIVPGAYHAKCREAAGMEYDTRVSGFFSRNL